MPLVALSVGEASGWVVADDCAGGAYVAVATGSLCGETAVVQAKARTAITQAINNVDLTLLSPYGGDVVSSGVVIERGCMAFCRGRRRLYLRADLWIPNGLDRCGA